MPQQGRLGDKSFCASDAHGCVACSHPVSGPAVSGSPNVFVNGLPALRVGDCGIHTACCGSNTWQAQQGSPTVFINGIAAHRINDSTKHCGGTGKLVNGSPNVYVGNNGLDIDNIQNTNNSKMTPSMESVIHRAVIGDDICIPCLLAKLN